MSSVSLTRPFGLALAVVLAVAGLFAGALLSVGAPATRADAAPGDQVSISIPGFGADFGYVKQGRVVMRTIEVLNDGVDAVSIDPAPLRALVAPFELVSTTLVAGETIMPNQRRNFVVRYTAPPARTPSLQNITLTAVDVERTGTATLVVPVKAESLTTDRAFFEVAVPGGGTTLDFGTVKSGESATKRLTLTVRGIDPLRFANADVIVRDQGGAVLSTVSISASSFGAGQTIDPSATPNTATVDLKFAPTGAGTFPGTITIVGRIMNGDPEALSVTVVVPLTARTTAAVDPTPTPTPTPTPSPTTPAPGTPGGGTGGTGTGGTGTGGTGTGGTGAGGTGSGAGGANSSTTGAVSAAGTGGAAYRGTGAGSGSLANTGADPAFAAGFAGLTLLAGGIALALARRSRRNSTR